MQDIYVNPIFKEERLTFDSNKPIAPDNLLSYCGESTWLSLLATTNFNPRN
jgi:hypothetical protein